MLLELLEKVRADARDMEGIYRLDLEGEVHDPARGFPGGLPDEQIAQNEKLHMVGRTLLVPIRDEREVIQQIARVALTLLMPVKGRGRWAMFLAADRPWTVQMAQHVIRGNLGPADAFNSCTGLFVPGRVHRFGPGFAGSDIEHTWARENKTLGVFAHAANRPTLMKHRRNLERLAPAYRDLLHISLYDDPRGENRANYVSHTFYRMLGTKKVEVQLPPTDGMAAMLPEGFPQEAIPENFPLRLTKKDATDLKKLEPWLEQLAAMRLDPRWATNELDGWVTMMSEPVWREDLARDSAVVLFEQVQTMSNERLENIKKMQAALKLVEDVKQRDEARGADLERAREQVALAQASERELRSQNQAQENELKQLRGLDAVALMAQRDEAQSKLTVVLQELRQAQDALRVLREHASSNSFRLSDLMPDTWQEVFPLAAIFRYVEVPDWAVQPAYGVLDRGQESGLWLRRTWMTLQKLEEYAAVKASGMRGPAYVNFYAFAQAFHSEYVTAEHVTLKESQSVRTNPVMRRSRTFDTPSGPQFFEAHVAVGSGKPPAPRLHFWDDTDESGKVFVGYVGPHLKNKGTN